MKNSTSLVKSNSRTKVFFNTSNHKNQTIAPSKAQSSGKTGMKHNKSKSRINNVGIISSQNSNKELEDTMASYINSGNHIQSIEPGVFIKHEKVLFIMKRRIGELGVCKVSFSIKDSKKYYSLL